MVRCRKRGAAWTCIAQVHASTSTSRRRNAGLYGHLVMEYGTPGDLALAVEHVAARTLAGAAELRVGLVQLLQGHLRLLLGLRVRVALGDVLQGARHLPHELVALGIVLGALLGAGSGLLGALLDLLVEACGGDGFLAGH